MYDWEGAPARYRETPAEAAKRTGGPDREVIVRGSLISCAAGPTQPARSLPPRCIRRGFEVLSQPTTPFHIHVA